MSRRAEIALACGERGWRKAGRIIVGNGPLDCVLFVSICLLAGAAVLLALPLIAHVIEGLLA